MTRTQVASAFVNGSEYRGNEILGFYRTILGREPESGAVPAWLGSMAQGETAQQIMSVFYSSDEYLFRHGGTVPTWLTALYEDILGRSADAAGLAAWTSVLQHGASRIAVASGFVLSAEELAREVGADYTTFLGRTGSGPEIAAWVTAMQRGVTLEQLHIGVTSSQEYVFQTFGAQLGATNPSVTASQTSSIQANSASPTANNAVVTRGNVTTSAGGVSLSVGPNIDVNKELGNQSEETTAVNPANPSQVFIASNENDIFLGMMASFSTDGGTTWSPRVIGDGTDGLPPCFSDPWVSFDEFGNLFFSYIGFPSTTNTTTFEVVIALSTNGGKTFSTLAQFPMQDQTQEGLTIFDHPELTSGHGEVFCTYAVLTATGGVAIAVSGAQVTGLGQVGAFKNVVVPGSDNENFGDVAIGPNGQVMVAMQSTLASTGAGPDRILVSLNPAFFAGGNFNNVRFNSVAAQINVGPSRFVTPSPDRAISANIGLAWDRSGGAHNGRLYLVYTDGADIFFDPNLGDTNIFVRFSDNNGQTWSQPVRVNDNINNHSTFFPKISVDQTTGNLAVAWYDGRNSPENFAVDVFTSVSLDGGLSFLPNVKVTTGPSDVVTNGTAGAFEGLNGLNDYGDYIGLAFFNNQYHVAWADNSTTLQGNPDNPGDPFVAPGLDIATATVSLTGPGFVPPNLPNDPFDPNNSFATAANLGVLTSFQTVQNLTINNQFGQDFFLYTAGRLGTLNLRIDYQSPTGGDLQLRVFTVNSQNNLIQIASSRLVGVTSQSVTASIPGVEPLFVMVNGFNGAQATYSISASLF
jgi:hypothetical protein